MTFRCFFCCMMLVFLTTALFEVEATDYFPSVPDDDPNVCFREISVCRVSREFRDDARERKQLLILQVEARKAELEFAEERIESLGQELARETSLVNSLAFQPNSEELVVLRSLRRLHKKQSRLEERNASQAQMKAIHRRIQRKQKSREQILLRRAAEYERDVIRPIEHALLIAKSSKKELEVELEELKEEKIEAEQEELEFDIYQEGFCSSYLAMCLPPVGDACLLNSSPDSPSPILFPEYYDANFPAHTASVLFRVRRDCETGQALERDEVIVLDGTQCNYTCRSRLAEDCFADGVFDTYLDEECYDSEGELIEIPIPDVAQK